MENHQVKVLAKTPVVLFVRELVSTDVRTSAISVSTNYFGILKKYFLIDACMKPYVVSWGGFFCDEKNIVYKVSYITFFIKTNIQH